LRSRFEKFAAKVYQVRQARGVIIKFGGSWQSNVDFCTTTVIDRLTTSFNWAEVDFGAIWLRAYPKTPAARKVIQAQAKCSIAT
jgi:hypothetical protein